MERIEFLVKLGKKCIFWIAISSNSSIIVIGVFEYKLYYCKRKDFIYELQTIRTGCEIR